MLNKGMSHVVSLKQPDQNYAAQYPVNFVDRWDELIDWGQRAKGEGSFFSDLLLRAGVCTVLDVATGTGFHAVQLRKAGFEVTACDGSPTMVERARRNFALHGVKIKLFCQDWLALDPVQIGTFDAVLCLGSSLCHLFCPRQRVEALRRFCTLLNPGGMLLVDQRNFQAILAGHFQSSGRYYYCGKSAKVTLGELSEQVCEFVYTYADGEMYRLRVCPVLPNMLRQEIQEAGLVAAKSYGDFKALYEPSRVDFMLHIAYPPESSAPHRSDSHPRGAR
jgi:glycine/sarcosine N-methyltransferase